jgi:hypothetical protein
MPNVKLNLEVYKAKDCGFISVLDTSFYPIAPDTANLQVDVPGYDTPFEFEFVVWRRGLVTKTAMFMLRR